ncbi:hypothetical protein K440DRAFT_629465 [Wilcoxina mikolae CBS 423.85]|nr:hypothetical protein K440DRAFT_629465 [Wilcoxina mikolae CBS 423.85]
MGGHSQVSFVTPVRHVQSSPSRSSTASSPTPDVGATSGFGAGTNTRRGDSHVPTPAGNNGTSTQYGITYDQGHTLYTCQNDDDDDDDDDDGSFDNLPFEDFMMSIAPTLPYSIKLRERRQAEHNDCIVQWIRSM